MPKVLLSEQEILEVINKEFTKNCARNDCYCLVGRLREARLLERNWEIDTYSIGGINLNTNECDDLRQNVLMSVAKKYDVRWLCEQ